MRERIAAYRIVRQLGEGGMGVVFEARHEQLERRVAVKVLHPELSRDPRIAARFTNEARAVNLVRHPGLVDIYELGQLEDGSAFIVMEFLEGEPLSARIALGARPVEETLRVGRQIASALVAVHEKGIVHRDLKPDNVMVVCDPEVTAGERVKVLDFGIAKLTSDVNGGALRTGTGLIMGTPRYMAPEQCRGAGAVECKADVYALGVILYEMCCGTPPFRGEGSGDVMAQHIYEDAPPLDGRVGDDVPDALLTLIFAMLAKAPESRPAMREVEAALEAVGAPGPNLRRAATGARPIAPRTTLGGASGQRARLTHARPARRRVAIALAGASCVLGAVGIFWVRHGARVVVPPAPLAASRPPAPPPAPAPAPRPVRWRVTTDPSGAEVRDGDTGEWLGSTPWERTAAPSSGVTVLVLAAPRREERRVVLDRNADQTVHEVLRPLPARRKRERTENEDIQLVH